MVAPTPTAGPLTATITGLREAAMRSEMIPPPSREPRDRAVDLGLGLAAPGERTSGSAAKVSARAEAAPGPGEQDDPDGMVGVGQVEGRDKFPRHGAGEGIEPVGPVQGQRGRAARHLVADLAKIRLAGVGQGSTSRPWTGL